MDRVVHLSLLSGPVPLALTLAAFASLAYCLPGRGRRWWGRVALLGVASLGVVVAVGMLFGVEHRVGSTFPHTFFVWAALPLFAAGVAAQRWAGWRWDRRAVSVLSVLLLVAFGAATVNAHYAYLPTVGDAIGRPIEHQVPARLITDVPAPTPIARAAHGAVVSVAIPGAVSRFHARNALVWLPPAYFTEPSPTLPVIEMLAGVPGDPSNLLRAGHAGRIADAYAAAHGGVAPILVFPDHNGSFLGDSECVDGPRGNAETYLTVDIPAYLAAHFHTAAGRSWAVAGYSEGGTCAVTLALRHPDRFVAFLDIAGDLHPNAASGRDERRLTVARLYGGSWAQFAAHDPMELLIHAGVTPPAAMFVAGHDDAHALAVAQQLAGQAQAQRLPVAFHVLPGGHTFALAHRALVDLFPLLADDVVQAARVASVA